MGFLGPIKYCISEQALIMRLFPTFGNIIMKRQVVICVLVSLLGTAMSDSDWIGDMTGSESYGDTIQTATQDQATVQGGGYGLLRPFYRYWKSSVSDHFYTRNPSEIGTVTPGQVGKHGYKSEGIACKLFTRRLYGLVPLYRYWKSSVSDHFYTTNAGEIGTTTPGQSGNHGYRSEGVAGYCFPRHFYGTVPLYRYWKASVRDHFYTTNADEIGTTTPGQVGKHGYKSEGVACYVYQ